ncbi:GGDEF domain-containing protein [Marinobacter sp. ANT_B65]|uniref:GGDEF domain-containing protein n=1 Tax=Marinobacter sp. ANT_B65 TaxID=2039467 RepID=UPI000BBE8318|nr:diguanylate cyclase [Marinobacter sp. ANT_B65]PCM43807.1 GGDEF domain-containing protein [Marinobacter sp. ANT_B65]
MAQTAEKFLLNRLSHASLAFFVVVAVLCAIFGELLTAASAAAAAGIIISGRSFQSGREVSPWPTIQKLFFAALILLLMTSFWTGPWALSHWLYGLVLVAFALVSRGIATLITVVIVVLAMAAAHWAEGIADRHQMISAFLLTIMLSAVLIFLRDYKTRQLAPLRRTDELTQAASREYLSADLHKEIQRSEREGTDMSIIMVGLDAHASDNDPDEDIRSILPRIGRFLHSQIRDFDTYYRAADLQFLVILPGIATQEAITQAETIRKGLGSLLEAHGMNLTVSTGIAGLNIGDDANSLHQSAANALRRAQQQGGNRTQAYSSRTPTTRAQPNAEGSAP